MAASLTPQEVWLFRHNGFIIPPGKLPDDLLDRVNAVTDRQVAEQIEPIVWKYDISDPGRRIVNPLSKILDRDAAYLEAATHPVVLDALEALIGPNIELLTNKHNMMMIKPGNAPPVEWHRGEALHQPPLLTVSIAFGDATMENGCLRIVPGSHVDPSNVDEYMVGGSWRRGMDFHKVEFFRHSVPVPVGRGQVLIFHDSVYHGSDANHTSDDRRALTFGYTAHATHDVRKDDPERKLVRGERAYRGHPVPGAD